MATYKREASGCRLQAILLNDKRLSISKAMDSLKLAA
jgi:hypothetical protein